MPLVVVVGDAAVVGGIGVYFFGGLDRVVFDTCGFCCLFRAPVFALVPFTSRHVVKKKDRKRSIAVTGNTGGGGTGGCMFFGSIVCSDSY